MAQLSKDIDFDRLPYFHRKMGETLAWNEELETWIRWETINGEIYNMQFVNEKNEWEYGGRTKRTKDANN